MYIPTTTFYQQSLAKCIVKIGDQGIVINPMIYVDKNNYTQITDDDKLFINAMIETMAHERVPIIIKSQLDFSVVDRVKRGSIIAIFTIKTCQRALGIRDLAFEPDVKYILLLNEKLSAACLNRIENRKKYAQENDITFIYKDDLKNKHNFLTFMPLRNGKKCNGSTPVHINTCVAGSLEKATVFPEKSIKNLGGCPLNMMFRHHPPFARVRGVTVPPSSDYITVTNATGSDVEIMKIFAQTLNAYPVFFLLREGANLPLSQLYNIHVFGGGWTLASASGPLALSATYGVFDTPWIYAAVRETRRWENFIANIPGIYFFLLFYVCYSFAWKAVAYFDGHAVSLNETFLYCWGALVGATSLQPARSFKQKILNITFMIMCIHVSTYFSTQMYSFLVIQKPPEMFRNHDEIMSSGRNIYFRPGATRVLKSINIVNFPENTYSCLDMKDCAKKTLEYNGVTMLHEVEFYPAQVQTAVQDEARLLRINENVKLRYLQFVLGYKNLENNQIKKITNALFEAGISQKLYMHAIGPDVIAKSKIAAKKASTNDYSCELGCSINMSQIAPVFYIWLVGCAFSCFVFLFELLWNNKSLRLFCMHVKCHAKIQRNFTRHKRSDNVNPTQYNNYIG